ncbi:hypothetical protein HJFPF1_07607 [Paramyrothecium foliicola]|nr:hypothetical protein HJFPF1_07607 [Paramyrothecium foliicola]
MCQAWFLGHYHHDEDCSRSWTWAFEYTFCHDAPVSPVTGVPDNEPCANVEYGDMPANVDANNICATSQCYHTADCKEGKCRCEDLNRLWRCCSTGHALLPWGLLVVYREQMKMPSPRRPVQPANRAPQVLGMPSDGDGRVASSRTLSQVPSVGQQGVTDAQHNTYYWGDDHLFPFSLNCFCVLVSAYRWD